LFEAFLLLNPLSESRLHRASIALILLASILVVALVTWFAPSLSSASTNILFRLRGEVNTSNDLVILAIDDRSLQRVGKWPWPRSVMAQALEKLSADRPRAVGLDVVYVEPSTELDDRRLDEAIKSNGRVVLLAQLAEAAPESADENDPVVWLRPVIGETTAAVGHAHASPDVDGILRSIQLSKADDGGTRLWAFGLEVLRVAEGIPSDDFEETKGRLRIGGYEIPLREEEEAGSSITGVTVSRPNEMLINYAGPPASFRRYSIADLLNGEIRPSTFTDKIVLVGSVAPSMGDARISPFINYGANDRQAGNEMPGVEIHANIVNTISQRLWLKQVPERYAFLIALAVIFLTALTIRQLAGWRQLAGLSLILLGILIGGFITFKYFMIIPPLPGMLAGFASAIPLLLNRSLNASRRLDLKLAALAQTQTGFLLDPANDSSDSKHEAWLDLPRDLASKVRAVDDITVRLLARMNFMDRVLSGMGEAVLVADTSGRIVFANPEAAEVFGTSPEDLSTLTFEHAFVKHGVFDKVELGPALKEATSGHVVQKEFAIQTADARRHYSLQISSITRASRNSITNDRESRPQPPAQAEVIGLVALITDTTRRVELEQTRMDTLQLVSHELRTPLTSIQGLSDVMLKFPVETVEAREMVSTIHAEAIRLSETINRYLDIARLEAGAQPLRIAPVRVEELLAECVRAHAPVALQKGIKIVPGPGRSVPPIAIDARLIEQAVNNLLSNAIKYGPRNSEVSLEVQSDGHNVLIRVRDEGAGIPIAERERVFEKFYRRECDVESGVVGTGLGLSLVKEIVEKHGGRVLVENAEDGGSAFTIQLPVPSRAEL